ANERVAYFNGEIVPESQVLVSFRDRGFNLGDGCFDTTRTFGHKIFKIEEHIARLFRTLRYMQIDPGLTPQEFIDISQDVLSRNLHLLDEDEDYWVFQRVTRGLAVVGGDIFENAGPTVIVECTPLPLNARAKLFRDGIQVVTPATRRVPPESLSPRAKTHNYLNLIMADREAKVGNPEAWAILLDGDGFLTEGMGSNFFLVENGRLYTPRLQKVLGGISRETVMELAVDLGIPCEEKDLELFDAYNADEAFISSTSLGLCPVHSVNGIKPQDQSIPGPITKKIMDAYVKLVDYDFVHQYLKRLDG
ncbi:MAG: aminotransferase class IV, partial [Planctomycetota bacterium]